MSDISINGSPFGQFKYTLIESTGNPVSKSLDMEADNLWLAKPSLTANITSGNFWTRTAGIIDDFAAQVIGWHGKPNLIILPGHHATLETGQVTFAGSGKESKTCVGRNEKSFGWRKGEPTVFPIDVDFGFDVVSEGAAFPVAVDQMLMVCVPHLASVRRFWKPSASSHVIHTDQAGRWRWVNRKFKWHCYVAISDALMAKAIAEDIFIRTYEAQYGYAMLGDGKKRCNLYDRSLIDLAVYQGSHEFFESGAILTNPALSQPHAEYSMLINEPGAAMLDVRTLPKLNTIAAWQMASPKRKKLRAELEPARLKRNQEIAAPEIARLVALKVAPADAARVVAESQKEGRVVSLYPDFELMTSRGRTFLAGDVYTDPSLQSKPGEGIPCRDPMEPEYSKTAGKLYAGPGQTSAEAYINSWAHGVMTKYRLMRRAAPLVGWEAELLQAGVTPLPGHGAPAPQSAPVGGNVTRLHPLPPPPRGQHLMPPKPPEMEFKMQANGGYALPPPPEPVPALPAVYGAVGLSFAELMQAVQDVGKVEHGDHLQALKAIAVAAGQVDLESEEIDALASTLKKRSDVLQVSVRVLVWRGQIHSARAIRQRGEHAARIQTMDAATQRKYATLGSLIRNEQGDVAANMANARINMKAAPSWDDALGFCEFSSNIVFQRDFDWGDGQISKLGEIWTDSTTTKLQLWLQHFGQGMATIGRENVARLPLEMAQLRSFHPVRDYLQSLHWDGVSRLEFFAERYLGATGDFTYLRAVSKCWFVSGIARVMRPGCKVDTMPILEGIQGAGKSTLIRTIAARDEWFTDTRIDFTSKDAMQSLQGVWFIEISELDQFNKKDVNTVKGFVSSQEDRFRVPYGTAVDRFKRQCVFVGTTNQSEYLRDETGGRRFWPIACGKVMLAALRRDINQLWAEAYAAHLAGAQWWLTDEENVRAETQQDERYVHDAWTDEVLGHARFADAKGGGFTSSMILDAMKINVAAQDGQALGRVSRVLKKADYIQRRLWGKGNERPRLWFPSPTPPAIV